MMEADNKKTPPPPPLGDKPIEGAICTNKCIYFVTIKKLSRKIKKI